MNLTFEKDNTGTCWFFKKIEKYFWNSTSNKFIADFNNFICLFGF